MAEVKQARIFLSYTRKDMGQVKELYEMLRGYGFSPWMDIFDLKTGRKWLEAIIEAIHEAPIFLACLSNESITKQGTIRREINEALDLAKEKILSGKDVYIFPIRLEEIEAHVIPMKLREYQWVDLFADDGRERLIKDLKDALKQLGFDNPLNLRSHPIKSLSPADAAQMIKERNFYDSSWWPNGQGLNHEYEPKTIAGDKVVIDHTTGLMWQQGGSNEYITYEKAEIYIKQLNRKKFAGFDNWRLPTLEEAMSLMESNKSKDGHYIDAIFAKTQDWIWTADQPSASFAWVVDFLDGGCFNGVIEADSTYVRAVRSGQSS